MTTFMPFPADMFPCTTIIKTMGTQQNATGGFKKIVTGELVKMGSVQELAIDQSVGFDTRGSKVEAIIYYKDKPTVNVDDVITWQDENLSYTVLSCRQESGFGLLWAVYCFRAK